MSEDFFIVLFFENICNTRLNMVSSLIVRPEPQKFLKILLDLIFYGFSDRNDVGELIDFNMIAHLNRRLFCSKYVSCPSSFLSFVKFVWGVLPTREFFTHMKTS